MGYTGCYLCTLCALWCCHATILIDKLVAFCHANMFNFSESIKPKSLHPGNSSIDQLDTMCCIGRAYVELATPRLFLQMRLFQSFLYLRNAHNWQVSFRHVKIWNYSCDFNESCCSVTMFYTHKSQINFNWYLGEQFGRWVCFPTQWWAIWSRRIIAWKDLTPENFRPVCPASSLDKFRWFGSFKGCSPSPYHPCMVYLYTYIKDDYGKCR